MERILGAQNRRQIARGTFKSLELHGMSSHRGMPLVFGDLFNVSLPEECFDMFTFLPLVMSFSPDWP